MRKLMARNEIIDFISEGAHRILALAYQSQSLQTLHYYFDFLRGEDTALGWLSENVF
jgi:hypothetical protein